MFKRIEQPPITVWAFDLGKASIGEAPREGNKFLSASTWFVPTEFSKKQTRRHCAQRVC